MFFKFFDKYISQKNFYFLILAILVLCFLCKNPDISIMLFVSILFATALNPLVDKLEKKMNRSLASAIVLTVFLIIIAVFVLPVLYLSAYEIFEFAKEFPQYVNHLDHLIGGMPVLKSIGITHVSVDTVTSALTTSSANIFESVFKFISETSAALLYIFTALVLLFFFLVDKRQIKSAVVRLFPKEYKEKTTELLEILADKLSGYVFAQTIVSGSVWLTMTVGLLAFKINYAILLGVIAGILSIIPVVGSAVSLVICLIATYEMGVKYLVIVTVLYTLSHFVENNVVRPYVYSKFLNIHQVLVFLALIVGAKYHGVLGIILAPPFAMVLCVLLDELYIKKMEQ